MPFDRKGFYREVGKRMKRQRERFDFTQQELADVLEMPRSTYANLERGRQRPPTDVLWRMAVYLGVSVDVLLPKARRNKEPQEYDHDPDATIGEATGEVAAAGPLRSDWMQETSGSG